MYICVCVYIAAIEILANGAFDWLDGAFHSMHTRLDRIGAA